MAHHTVSIAINAKTVKRATIALTVVVNYVTSVVNVKIVKSANTVKIAMVTFAAIAANVRNAVQLHALNVAYIHGVNGMTLKIEQQETVKNAELLIATVIV